MTDPSTYKARIEAAAIEVGVRERLSVGGDRAMATAAAALEAAGLPETIRRAIRAEVRAREAERLLGHARGFLGLSVSGSLARAIDDFLAPKPTEGTQDA